MNALETQVNNNEELPSKLKFFLFLTLLSLEVQSILVNDSVIATGGPVKEKTGCSRIIAETKLKSDEAAKKLQDEIHRIKTQKVL